MLCLAIPAASARRRRRRAPDRCSSSRLVSGPLAGMPRRSAPRQAAGIVAAATAERAARPVAGGGAPITTEVEADRPGRRRARGQDGNHPAARGGRTARSSAGGTELERAGAAGGGAGTVAATGGGTRSGNRRSGCRRARPAKLTGGGRAGTAAGGAGARLEAEQRRGWSGWPGMSAEEARRELMQQVEDEARGDGGGAGPRHQGAGPQGDRRTRSQADPVHRDPADRRRAYRRDDGRRGDAAQRRDERPDHRPRGTEHPRLRARHRGGRHHRRHARHGGGFLLRPDPARGGPPGAGRAHRRRADPSGPDRGGRRASCGRNWTTQLVELGEQAAYETRSTASIPRSSS